MAAEELSRRQKVQIEDAAGAMKMASIISGQQVQATAVTFRHLALLAQTKNNDADVWASLQASGALEKITPQLQDRLNRMRYWIQSSHFPDEMRINILTKPNLKVIQAFTEEEAVILRALFKELSNCEWNQKGITAAIPRCVETLGVSHKWIAYKVAYLCLMGIEKGPRLAPILAEMNRVEIIQLLNECIQVIGN